ncbi:MAG TPA: hypothetical protein ENO00_11090, partial [Deltaproteobacteria bacterium]|nr:hypothetical protein [Deltaproteobacteria bacterium]
NRDMAHHDQLSIEYYSRGDLLLADAGENKYVLDKYYGQYGVHHNAIQIEDPRTPFAASDWADSRARGVYKGSSGGITTPVMVEQVIQTSWMEGIVASETVARVIDDDWSTSVGLTSPIEYSRTILYPDDDYFVIVDRLAGGQNWIYRNVLRPSSLTISPTIDKNKDGKYVASEVGHVEGSLRIGKDSFDWLSLPYKRETATGITTNSISWETTNPYNRRVQLSIFSVPSSEIIVTKHVGRIAGYDAASEVFTPVVYLRNSPSEELSRITVLISGYLNEDRKKTEELPVTGTGNAMQVSSPATTDTIYSGEGNAFFDVFETDATMMWYRQPKNSADYYCLLSGGTYLRMDGDEMITIAQTDAGMEATVNLSQNGFRHITRDGVSYAGYQVLNNGSAVTLYSDQPCSAFEIQSPGQTAHIILLNEIASFDESSLEKFPSEEKTGRYATCLVSGTIAIAGICWCRRKRR